MFPMEVVARLLGPPGAGPGVAAAVRDDDVPVVGQRVVGTVTVQPAIMNQHLEYFQDIWMKIFERYFLHHLLGGGGAQSPLHLAVTVSIAAGQAGLWWRYI